LKIEALIRHQSFEPIRSELLDKGFPSSMQMRLAAIRIRTGEEGADVLQTHGEEQIAAGAGQGE
jgi:nitrogen regulatory protein PII